jgi:hypothetical protein
MRNKGAVSKDSPLFIQGIRFKKTLIFMLMQKMTFCASEIILLKPVI